MAKRWKDGRTANLAHCCKYVEANYGMCTTTVRIVLQFSYLHNS